MRQSREINSAWTVPTALALPPTGERRHPIVPSRGPHNKWEIGGARTRKVYMVKRGSRWDWFVKEASCKLC